MQLPLRYAGHRDRAVTCRARCTIALALLGVLAVRASAQTCEPTTTSNEAKIFGNRSLALAFGRGAPVTDDAPGTVYAGVELAMLPHVSDATATPTQCRPGKGPENVNALPGIARLNASVALPAHFSIAANWLPPVTLKGMDGDVLSVALGYSRSLAALNIAARAYTTFGHITGPITCSDAALHDINSECFAGTRSSDRYEPNITGGDVAIGSAISGSRFAWYGGVGYEQLKPRFQVHFLNQSGSLDTTRVQVDLTRVTLFAGGAWSFGERWRLDAELFATPDDGVTARLAWTARFGPHK